MSLPLPTAGEEAAQGSILLGNIAAKEDALRQRAGEEAKAKSRKMGAFVSF